MYLMQKSFNAGVWTDLLDGRTDLAKYPYALARLENFIIDPRGPAVFRPGLRYVAAAKYSDKASRLIPFSFSSTQTYQIEFGEYYVRFYMNRARIHVAATVWVTATVYALGDIVSRTNVYYRCIVAHTSGTFTTDLGNLYWEVIGPVDTVWATSTAYVAGEIVVRLGRYYRCLVDHTSSVFITDLFSGNWVLSLTGAGFAYEIPSPYPASAVTGLKYCQSADVLYLWHSSYPSMKLSRTGHTAWVLAVINWRPPAIVEAGIKPSAELTLAAVSGTSVTFTSNPGIFQSGDVKRLITSGVGRASITTYLSATQVTCDIIDAFSSVGPIAIGDWKMLGSPYGALTPSIKEPVGGICTLSASATASSYTNLLEVAVDDWIASGSGTNEYYLVNTAPFFQTVKPAYVYENGVACVEGIVGTLGVAQWDWGDNDILGYDTIYIRLTDGVDPDNKSAIGLDFVKCSSSASTNNLFRSGDVGKYIRIHNGLVKLTIYTSGASVSGEIIKVLDFTTATTNWTLESAAWNATDGYPSFGLFYEERLVCAGSNEYPETVWGSAVGDYENFTPGVDDSDSYSITISGRQVNIIRWMEAREYLIVGTSGAEWRLGPEDSGKAMTPLNIVAKFQTPHGSVDMMPEAVGNSTLFVQATGKKIRELTYKWEENGFVAPDLTVLAEQVTYPGIAAMAYQKEPNSILWVALSDGGLAGMTYLRDQDVVGWHEHPLQDGAEVESVSCIQGAGSDELWMIVKRVIDGQTVRYIELMAELFRDGAATYAVNKGLNAFFVDCGITYDGAATVTITGLAHLNGETVSVLADGSYQAPKVVSNGEITLDAAASVVHVGLPYTGLLKPMRIDVGLQSGTAQGRDKQVHQLTFRIIRSGPFKAGRDENNLADVTDREMVITLGAPYPLYSGDLKISHEDTWKPEGDIVVVQDKPMPLTLSAIIAEVTIL